MANDNSLPPNDSNPLHDPDSPFRPAEDWILNDQNETKPPRTEPIFDDDALGLDELPPNDGSSTSFVSKIKFPVADPDDALADLPPVNPAAPGSGWLDVPVPAAAPAPKRPVQESSDIFSAPMQGESDVIRNLASEQPPSSSNIFDSPLAGSSRFANIEEGTEDSLASPPAAEAADEPSSDFFTDDPDLAPLTGSEATDMIESLPLPVPASGDSSSGPDFNRTSSSDSGSNLFADADDELSFGESGVNLNSPNRGPDSGKFGGMGSSIFGSDLLDLDAGGRADVDEIPLMGSSDDRTEESLTFGGEPEMGDGTSNIFEQGKRRRGGTAPSDINLENPSATDLTEELAPSNAADGDQIDWSLPDSTIEDQLDAQMSVMPSALSTDTTDLNGIFDEVQVDESELPITASTKRKPQPGSGRTPQTQPVRIGLDPPKPSRTRPIRAESDDAPVARRGYGVGAMIAGGIIGIVLGAGGFAGAYFTGALPETEEKRQAAKELTGKLTYAELNARDAKAAAEKAEANAKAANDKYATANASLTKARSDATTANSALTKARADLTSANQARTKADQDRQKAVTDLAAAKTSLDNLGKQLTDATTKVTDLSKEVTTAKKQADDQAALAKAAEDKAAVAQDKAKAADAAVGVVIKELKANKLVDDKDDQAAVLAKLPDVVKKITTAASSADAQKTIAALNDAMKKADEARTDAKKAQDAAALAKASADKANQDAKAAMTALAVAKDDAQKKQDEMRMSALLAEAKAKLAQEDLAAKLAAADRTAAGQALLIEQLRKQVVEARSGAVVPLSAPELASREQAESLFGSGADRFFSGRYAEAERMFKTASATYPNDARVWYFLGLSQWMQGNQEAAEPAFKKGAELESRGQPGLRAISAALERVQGPARQALAKYRP